MLNHRHPLVTEIERRIRETRRLVEQSHGRDEKQRAGADLNGHQSRSQARPTRIGRCLTARRLGQPQAREAPGGCERNEDRGQDRRHGEKRQHAPVGIQRNQNVVERHQLMGNVARMAAGNTRAVTTMRASPAAAAGTREHQAFHDQLARHTPPAGAKRQANGDFRLPCQRARQHQIRDVRGGDQQHEAERRQDEHEHRQRLVVEGDAGGERVDAHGHWRRIGRRGKTLTQPDLEPRTHRGRGHVLPQAADDGERRRVWRGPRIDARKRARHRQWRPEPHELLAGADTRAAP